MKKLLVCTFFLLLFSKDMYAQEKRHRQIKDSDCCKQLKTYSDFSFLGNNVVQLDTSFAVEPEISFSEQHQDGTWTTYRQYSSTFDIGSKLYSENEALYIFYGKDTLLLNKMLGPDSVYITWFGLPNFYSIDVYRLINGISGARDLYMSWGHDNVGNRPGSRINFVFPLSNDNRIEGGFAYVTNTGTPETDPCLDCFTDFNRDGKTDYVQWIFSADTAPVKHFNYSKNGTRTYHNTAFSSVLLPNAPGMAWEILSKKQLLHRK